MKTTDILIKTSEGELTLRVDETAAPITAKNFIEYVSDGFYDGTIFHRVIDNFMIQGGGFTADMNQKETRPTIKLESKNGLKNKRGTAAMARTQNPNSASSQFFINLVDNAFLDNAPGNDGYAVFGEVVAGMDTVDKIKGVATGRKNGHDDVPTVPVTIESMTIAGS